MNKPLALVIADDRRLGDTLVDLFELLGFRCEFRENAKQAKEVMRKFKPDIALIDHPFYKRTGLEILTDIRTDLRLRDTKVIVITTDDHADTAELRLADAVLLKPFSFDLLEETVYELTDNPASSDDGELEPFNNIRP
jgi:CheY-like chemotaxis protein